MISESLMHLQSASEDENFMFHQRKIFEEYNEKTRLELLMC
jgi:hypothetical protein